MPPFHISWLYAIPFFMRRKDSALLRKNASHKNYIFKIEIYVFCAKITSYCAIPVPTLPHATIIS